MTTLFPVYEFRPLPGFLSGPVRRYADGRWIEDDGEYDTCFISGGYGPPIALYFSHSYQRNITVKWIDGHWSAREPRHPSSNAWHYALRRGAKTWGGDWGRDRHENTKVGEKGMSTLSGEFRCANGRSIELVVGDPHIAAGLVRNRDTGIVLEMPRGRCMYCGDQWHETRQHAAKVAA